MHKPAGDVDRANPPQGGSGTIGTNQIATDQEVQIEALKAFTKKMLQIVCDLKTTLECIVSVSDDKAMSLLAESTVNNANAKIGEAFDSDVIDFLYKKE